MTTKEVENTEPVFARNKLWVLCTLYDRHLQTVEAVYTSEELAVEGAKTLMKNNDYLSWKEVPADVGTYIWDAGRSALFLEGLTPNELGGGREAYDYDDVYDDPYDDGSEDEVALLVPGDLE